MQSRVSQHGLRSEEPDFEPAAEESLRQAELRHRRFLDAVPVGVIDWTWDGAIRNANDCFLRMIGYSREDLDAGRIRWSELTPEKFRQRDQEALAELQATGRNAPYEKVYVRKDGSPLPILLSCVMQDPGNCWEGTAFVLDLTEQRRAERALRESEQRLRFHVEHTSLGLVEWDAEFVITRWSDEAERIFGWTAAEAVGKHPAELHLVHDEDQSIAQQVMGQLTNGVTRRVVASNRNYTKDGKVVHCKWYNSVLVDEHGQISSIMSFVQDRTASVEAEQALCEAKQLAEAANAAKRQFLANMSHEMRTPLTAIVGFAELLTQPNLCGEDSAKYLEAIQRNTRTLLRLIDNILDFSKIEAGKLVIEPTDCCLWQIMHDVLSATGAGHELKHLRLEVEYKYPLPDMIRTDPLRLWQILVNLVGNAVKFTQHGGVRITVALDPPGPAEKRWLRFTVSDTGIGIRPEWQGQLFEPFAQDDVALSRRRSGVGLGLPIAARLAELLGTHIELASQSGPGATFTFALDPGPLEGRRMLWAAPRDPGDEDAVADQATVTLAGRVLLAEDAPDTQELLRINLQAAGLRVDVANDGLAAVRQALAAASAGQPYDLILMDLEMPELDGFEAMRLLRASAWPGPVVALTAHTTIDDQNRCREAGFDGYLPKPVTRGTLLAAVRQCLERKPTARAEPRQVDRPVAKRRRGKSTKGAQDTNCVAALPARDVATAPRPRPGQASGVTAGPDPNRAVTGETPDAERIRLLMLFAGHLPQRLARLEQSLCDQDRVQLVQTAHQLVGAAGQFGFPQIAEAAEKLEQQASGGTRFEALAELLEAVRDAAQAGPPLRRLSAESPPAAKEKRRHRVLLADDDELVRAALGALVDGLAEFQVVAEAADGREAIQQAEQQRPEVILMDIAMPELDGLNAAAQVAAVCPQAKVIILSGHVREESVLQALQAGAVGYLLKSAHPAELEQALSAVIRGETYFCAAAAQHLAANCAEEPGTRAKPLKHLTPRQLEVLKRIAEGDSTKMIARKLRISVKTAEHHRANMMTLLDIHDTASLVRYAVRMGLVEPNR